MEIVVQERMDNGEEIMFEMAATLSSSEEEIRLGI
jgi:hypothetical protein